MAVRLVTTICKWAGVSSDAKPSSGVPEGSIIVTPGYHVSPYASAVNNATFQFSWLWEEYTP